MSEYTVDASRISVGSLIPRMLGIVGCLAVAAIHVIDQGGLPGSKDPEYAQILYYILEVAGVVAAILLLTSYVRWGWFVSLGVAVGLTVGYVLSRVLDYPTARTILATGPNRSESSA